MSITIKELLTLKNPIIIDIRSKLQYNNGHILNAINVNSIYLLATPDKYLNKNETYYIYCASGFTSAKVCNHLSKLGYKVVNLLGGYEVYKTLK